MDLLVGSPEPVEASFNWDRREHARIIRDISRGARLRVWATVLAPVAVVTVLILAPRLAYGESAGHAIGAVWGWLAALACWMVVLQALSPSLTAWRYGKLFENGPRVLRVRVTSDGIQTRGPLSDSFLRWSAISRVVERDGVILFFTTPACAHYLPKRAVSTDELCRVRQLVEPYFTPHSGGDVRRPPAPERAAAGGHDPVVGEGVRISYAWDRRRGARAIRAIISHGSARWWNRIAWIVVAGLLVAGIGLPLALGRFRQTLPELPVVLWPAALILLFRFGQPLFAAWRFETFQAVAGARLEVDVSPEGVCGRAPKGEVRVQWASVRRVIETPEFLLFYTGPAAAITVPKQVASDAELGRIRVMIDRCFSRRRGT